MKIFLFTLILLTTTVHAQDEFDYLDSTSNDHGITNKLDKKFLWGVNYTLGWSNLVGLDSFQSFIKPSVGAGLKVDFFPVSWFGVSAGLGHLMRGAGIITDDFYQGLGERDSTFRCRWRTNNINIPISIILRSPFKIAKNSARLALFVGVTPSKAYMAHRVFLSVEDGFHDKTSIGNYSRGWDLNLHGGIGVDMNAGNTTLFRLQFYGEMGMKNMYYNPSLNTTSGKNQHVGLEIFFMF